MINMNTRPNPYVGPRAFQTGENLYGRDREVRELLDLLIAERIVLLHSPSGAGKSSLVQAGLVPALEDEGFEVLPPVRVNQELPTSLPGDESERLNRYTVSVLLSLEEATPGDTPLEELVSLSLDEYLEQRHSPGGQDQVDEGESLVLIFDQFEEALTVDATDHDTKLEFFAQLGLALRHRHLWVLFVMREDYMAALDPYLRPIPTRLGNTYRLDNLGVNAAHQAIQQPVQESGVEFTPDAVNKLINDLRLVQVQRPDGTMEVRPGLYVEPVQLQVVCYHLWEQLPADKMEINEDDLSAIGNVDQSLAEYYAQQVAVIAEGAGVKERRIRNWFEHQLITEGGIRGQERKKPEEKSKLENQAIKMLEDAHLVRAEKRLGATWFELSHDRLIRPVRGNNSEWFQANLSLLQRSAALWGAEKRPDNLLLRDQALVDAEAWAADNADDISEIDSKFLETSQEARQQEQKERERQEQAIKLQAQQRWAKILSGLLIFAVGAAVVAGILGVLARNASVQAGKNESTALFASTLAKENETDADAQRITAEFNANDARTQESIAQVNESTATAALATAFHDRATATAALSTAKAAEATAKVDADNASVQAALADSRRLASQAMGYLDTQPDLTALLGIEAWSKAGTITGTYEARNVLLTRLQRGLSHTIEEAGGLPDQDEDVRSIALSLDGQHLVWGKNDGTITLWNYEDDELVWVRKGRGEARVDALAFGKPNSQYLLASGGPSTFIFLWEKDGTSTSLKNDTRVFDLSFSPDGQQLAAAVGNSVVIFDLNNFQKTTLGRFNSIARSVAWSPNGDMVAAGGQDNKVKVWAVDDNSLKINHSAHKETVWGVAWKPDSKTLASASEDNTIILWDVNENKQIQDPIIAHEAFDSYSVSFSSNGKTLASAGANNKVALWDVETHSQIAEVDLGEGKGDNVSVRFSPAPGELTFAASSDKSIDLFELTPQQPLNKVSASFAGEILSIASPKDGSRWIAERRGSLLNVWDLSQDPEKPKYPVRTLATSAAFSPDGGILAIGDDGGIIQLLDLPSGDISTPFASAEYPILSLAFSPHDKTLLSSQCVDESTDEDRGNIKYCSRHEIRRWDTSSGEDIGSLMLDRGSNNTGHQNYIRALAIDPSGNILASAGDDHTIQFWDINDGSPIGLPLERHLDSVTSLAFSPDGLMLASSSAANELLLWDRLSLQVIGEVLSGSPSSITSMAYSPDNSELFTGDSSGTLLTWDVGIDSWMKRNCELAGRNLTLAEWEQFDPNEEYLPTCEQFPIDSLTSNATPSPTSTPTPSP